MLDYSIITTFSTKHWDEYGKDMIESYSQLWPVDIPLFVYLDGSDEVEYFKEIEGPEIYILDYYNECPKQQYFMERHKDKPWAFIDEYNGIDLQVIRFSYKVFAQIAHIRKKLSKYVIWLDGDVVTKATIDKNWLNQLKSDDCYLSALLRPGVYTETGFILFDTTHKYNSEFINRYEQVYTKDTIFEFKAKHDCIAFDYVREQMQAEEKIKTFNLSPKNHKGYSHPFVEGVLGERLDHLKGKRKQLKYSPERRWN